MDEVDNVAYFRKWADDIRLSEGPSVDADKIEEAANELATARELLKMTVSFNIALDDGQPIVVYHDLANIWSCEACPSVTFHLYSDGNARCISCGLMAPEFISAYPDLHAARQHIKTLKDEIRELERRNKILRNAVWTAQNEYAHANPHSPFAAALTETRGD